MYFDKFETRADISPRASISNHSLFITRQTLFYIHKYSYLKLLDFWYSSKLYDKTGTETIIFLYWSIYFGSKIARFFLLILSVKVLIGYRWFWYEYIFIIGETTFNWNLVAHHFNLIPLFWESPQNYSHFLWRKIIYNIYIYTFSIHMNSE